MEMSYFQKNIENYQDTEFKDYVRKYEMVIPIATPVFDGAKEKDVTKC